MAERLTICVDTTELFDSPRFNSASWEDLLARARRGQVLILVPKVVLLETQRRYSDALNKGVKEIKHVSRALKQLGVEGLLDDEAVRGQQASLEEEFLAHVENRLVDVGAVILQVPDASHTELLSRDLARRKPFGESGKGYRDTLIWHSLLAYLSTNELCRELVLVTGNKSDFCDSQGGLASELRAEVDTLGVGATVTHVHSIGEVLKRLRDAFADEDETLLGQFEEVPETIEGILLGALPAAAEQLVGEEVGDVEAEAEGHRLGWLAIAGVVPDELEGVTVVEVDVNESSVDFSVYDQYEGDTLGIHASIEADVTFEGYLYKGDFPLVDERVEVVDADWNDHMMLVAVSATVRLSFQVLVIGTQVENVEFEFGESV